MHWLYAHLIGDYLIQNDWMAIGKKKSWSVAMVHVLTYLFPFYFTNLECWQIALIGLQHLIQDRTNIIVWFMTIKGSGGFIKPPFGPWSVVLVDNIVHILWMAWVSSLSG